MTIGFDEKKDFLELMNCGANLLYPELDGKLIFDIVVGCVYPRGRRIES